MSKTPEDPRESPADLGTDPTSTPEKQDREILPFYQWMDKVPGGLMLIPLILGSIVGTWGVGFLELGSFTTALFANSALPLIALLIFATGTQVSVRTSGPVLATAGVVLLMKSIIPASLVIALGWVVGLDGIFGLSILGLLAMLDNSNGGLWLAFTGRYGDKRDRGPISPRP
nr:2-keto-3-deoxygluconate permease [Ornithinimicrobium pratense]